MRRLSVASCVLIGLLLGTGCGRSAPSSAPGEPVRPAPSGAPAQASQPSQPVQAPQPSAAPAAPLRPSDDGFTTRPTSSGFPSANATVTGISTTSRDGGGTQVTLRFSQGIPLWAIHSSSRGQMLWLEMSAPAQPNRIQAGGYGINLGSAATSSWLTVTGRGVQEFRITAHGNSLVLEVRPASRAQPDSGLRVPPGADALVEQFLKAQVQGTDVSPYLSETAQAHYAKLPAFRPTEYSILRQSGQVPDTLLYAVRLTNAEAFTDQFLFVTPGVDGPQISLILGHQPVVRPTDPDGSAALTVAFAYLDAWAKRDSAAMYAALAPAEQQGMTEEQKRLLGGVSNPHPFRYEVHSIEQAAPGCYRLQVLRSEEYTGEGELGRGVAPLYVTQADGRYGVLLKSECGR